MPLPPVAVEGSGEARCIRQRTHVIAHGIKPQAIPVERRRVCSRTSYKATCVELEPEAVMVSSGVWMTRLTVAECPAERGAKERARQSLS